MNFSGQTEYCTHARYEKKNSICHCLCWVIISVLSFLLLLLIANCRKITITQHLRFNCNGPEKPPHRRRYTLRTRNKTIRVKTYCGEFFGRYYSLRGPWPRSWYSFLCSRLQVYSGVAFVRHEVCSDRFLSPSIAYYYFVCVWFFCQTFFLHSIHTMNNILFNPSQCTTGRSSSFLGHANYLHTAHRGSLASPRPSVSMSFFVSIVVVFVLY